MAEGIVLAPIYVSAQQAGVGISVQQVLASLRGEGERRMRE